MKYRVDLLAALALLVLAGACATPEASTDSTTTPTTPPTTAAVPTTTQAPDTTLPAFPPAREDLEHGGETWAVVLAGGTDPSDEAIVAAEAAAAAAGYEVGWTDCDEGAAAALGMAEGTITISVYFDTEEYAEAAAAAFAARGVNGVVAEVRTYCLD